MGDEQKQDTDQTPRSGRCALLGRPNVGKSTLLNRLLGQKLVIATPTPGTTRSCVLGVYASDDPPTQIAFLDTPGMGKQKNALANMLREQTKTGLSEVDVVVLMTDVRPKQRGEAHSGDDTALRLAEASERPVILAINKVDLLRDKRQLLPLIEAYKKRLDFVGFVPISAEKGTNLGDLVDEIRARLPEGLMYDEDFLTDRPERFFVAELVREAALSHTREEVPHGVAVVIDEYDEQGDMVRIHATVVVEKESHKGIVIGAKGARLKQIGTDARVEIERFLGRKVFLKLWVKVVPGWTGDPHKARRLVDEGTT